VNRCLLYSALALITLLTSCAKEPPIPSYIHIPAINVATDYATQGSATSNISDAWVYINDQLLGVYTLPATFPVQNTGPTDITIVAGIKLNGIAATRAAYPLYNDTVVRQVDLEETKTDTIQATVRYFSSVVFPLKEDFETGNSFIKMDKVSGSEALEGTYSGKIEVDSGITQAVSGERYQLPPNASAVFLELDYKNDHIFGIGMNLYKDGVMASFTKVALSPKTDWNKVYVNLTPEVTQNQADEYEIVFTVNTSNETVDPSIYLDNIKLVYLP
jgi:hypothetical protein